VRSGVRAWGPTVVATALALVGGSAVTVAAAGLPEDAAPPAAAAAPAAGTPADLSAAPLDGAPAAATPAAATPAVGTVPAAPRVAPLDARTSPDLAVRLPASLTDRQVSALRAIQGVEALTVLDTGTVRLAGGRAALVGVDPSEFRAFTPQETATSDALWQSVARGEIAPTSGLAAARDLPLGGTVTVRGPTAQRARVGAIAAYGLPDVDVVADRTSAARYGAEPRTGVLLSAPDRSVAALQGAVRGVVGAAGEVTVLRPAAVAPATAQGQPTTYRELYVRSATLCPGMRWQLLAAIGQVESGHGQNNGPSSAGALGPMQFLPSTWEDYGVDGDRDGDADIGDPLDAVPAAALYLCQYGAGRGSGEYDAVYAYNHLDSYVQTVLDLAAKYQ